MARKTIDTFVEVDIYPYDFETDELLDEIESRGLTVLDKEDAGAISEAARDEIYELYRDYVSGNDFDRKLKVFFEGQLGILVH